jgi:hypothetical protein
MGSGLRSVSRCAISRGVETKLKYRNRIITDEDINLIRSLMAEHPADSRRGLSKRLCQAWNWVQANGQLRDMVCRSLLLQLERAGHIALPPKRCFPINPLIERKKPDPPGLDQTPIELRLSQLPEPVIRQVRRLPQERLFNALVEHYHYLGYRQPVGEHLKHLVFIGERPVACFCWSSAPRHLGPRDRFIGWSPALRRKNLHLIAYNSRFLILPWVRVPSLASYLLARMARTLPRDWQSLYGHPIVLLETFVDSERFRGTCYRAANWVHLGQTTGRGKNDLTHRANRSLKDIWIYPLSRSFRQILCK